MQKVGKNKTALPKKSKRKLNFDVYRADDADEQASKLERRRGGGGGQPGRNYDQVGKVDFATETVDSEDDEEISEDDAFDDDDEDKYGLFFTSKQKRPASETATEVTLDSGSGSDEEDGDFVDISEMLDEQTAVPAAAPKQKTFSLLAPKDHSDSGSEQELDDFSDEEAYESEADLSSLVNQVAASNDTERKRKRLSSKTETFDESEFKGIAPSQKKLAMADLMMPVADETTFGDVKRQLVVLGSAEAKTLSAPLAPRLQDRLNRQAANAETKKSISKWIPIVKENRRAETLSFPMNEPAPVILSSEALVGKFEMEEKRMQLARMRSLLFFQEQKQKKIAKIKSKTYRKIAKKAAQKGSLSVEELSQLDPALAKEEKDRLDFERARERMTLKHKNTGKWAKRMLGRSAELGSETHKAMMEQLARGEKLRQRIQGVGSDSDSFSDQDGQDAVSGAMTELAQLKSQVDEAKAEPKGVFAMKFMQKGLEAQREKIHQSILDAERELTLGEDVEPQQTASTVTGRHQVKRTQDAPSNITPRFDGLEDVEFQTKSSGPCIVQPKALFKVDSFGDLEVPAEHCPVPSNEPEAVSVTAQQAKPAAAKEPELNSNPWLDGETAVAVKKRIVHGHNLHERNSKMEKSYSKIANERKRHIRDEREGDDTIELKDAPEAAADSQHQEIESLHEPHLDELTTTSIMQMAFADDNIAAVGGPSLTDQEFEKEKEQLTTEDAGEVVKVGLPGWGDWSGPGISSKPKITVTTKAGAVKDTKRKDYKLQKVIINEKRQKKARPPRTNSRL
ncbi:hypothetical protein HDU91_001224 [Kappamyces sp. JEL0680]|nr:hypothetical protein HDU91_001224 [Kappamyces sp. JEL0680]